VCGCPEGLLDVGNFGKLFLSFFLTAFAGIQHLVGENSSPWNVATRYRCAPKVTILLLFRVGNMALKSKVAHTSSLALRV
jgi:hypothetical protein